MTALQRIRERTHSVLEGDAAQEPLIRAVRMSIMGLIALNVAAFIAEPSFGADSPYKPFFQTFDTVSVILFTIEYLLRVWSSGGAGKLWRRCKSRLRFALTPMAMVDLVAILPFYLPMATPLDLRVVRILRLLRLTRLFKLSRYSAGVQLMGRVLRERLPDLVSAFAAMAILLILSSSLIYFAEHEAQPERFSSILASMWWGVATLTTVGYGDVYPITVLGKLVASVAVLLGIGLAALPAGVIASGHMDLLRDGREKKPPCPVCSYTNDLGDPGSRSPEKADGTPPT